MSILNCLVCTFLCRFLCPTNLYVDISIHPNPVNDFLWVFVLFLHFCCASENTQKTVNEKSGTERGSKFPKLHWIETTYETQHPTSTYNFSVLRFHPFFTLPLRELSVQLLAAIITTSKKLAVAEYILWIETDCFLTYNCNIHTIDPAIHNYYNLLVESINALSIIPLFWGGHCYDTQH